MGTVFPVPIFSCLTDQANEDATRIVLETIGNDPRFRMIVVNGSVEYGLHNFGSRTVIASHGEVVGIGLAARFSLPASSSWVDEITQRQCTFFKCTGQQEVFAGRRFYAISS